MSKVMHILQGDRINRLQCLDCRLGYNATSSDRNLSNLPRNELPQGGEKKRLHGIKNNVIGNKFKSSSDISLEMLSLTQKK